MRIPTYLVPYSVFDYTGFERPRVDQSLFYYKCKSFIGGEVAMTSLTNPGSFKSCIIENAISLTRKSFVYCKIQPMMTSEKDDTCDLSDVNLQENSDAETQCKHKLSKKPKRVLQFSDGVMEEYSSEDEVDTPKDNKSLSQIDTKNMNWLPWAWHQTTSFSSKMLDGCDYVGECLANFFGITAPKYQFEINEYYRLQKLEREMLHQQDLEMGGWNEQNRNNLINSNSIF